MPNFVLDRDARRPWWEQLGLHGGSGFESRAAHDLLKSCRPTTFVREGADGTTEHLGLEQLVALIEAAEREEESRREAAVLERSAAAEAEFESAFTMPDAKEPILTGKWCGFTRGEATAWCHNLFQYEPRGFVHPGSEVRVRAITALRDGHLPEVFGYPERAQELRRAGLTPRSYREFKQALGAKVFDPSQVRRR